VNNKTYNPIPENPSLNGTMRLKTAAGGVKPTYAFVHNANLNDIKRRSSYGMNTFRPHQTPRAVFGA
jgi:hypothetical protein